MYRCLICLLTGILNLTSVAEGQSWVVQERCDAFSLMADYDVDAQGIQTQLTGLASELNETLGVTSAGEPIQILLFESRKKYLAYVGSAVPASRDRRAVFVRKGRLTTIYCYRSDQTSNDLRHEMTHALLHQYLQFLPLWMDEGLAEYFEETPEQRPSSARSKNIRWKSAVGWSPDLDRLERIAVAGEMNSTDYRDSWAICCYLLNESRETRALLRDYLQQIHNGHAPLNFSESLNGVGNDWPERCKFYLRKPVFHTAAEFSNLR